MGRAPARGADEQLGRDVVEIQVTTPGDPPLPLSLGPPESAAQLRERLSAARRARPDRVRRLVGWEEVEIVRPLDAASGYFRLLVPPGLGPGPFDVEPFPVRPGDQVVVRLLDLERLSGLTSRRRFFDEEQGIVPSRFPSLSSRQRAFDQALVEDTLLTGYVDAVEAEWDARRGRRVVISGRDRTADLVDCAATNEPGQWIGAHTVRILRDLVEPFGLELVTGPGSDEAFRIVPRFELQTGESAFDALERLVRLHALLSYTDGLGRLVVEAPTGTRRAQGRILEPPQERRGRAAVTVGNVIGARLRFSHADRHRLIIVRGQRRGSDAESGEIVAHVEARAEDGEIRRFRPLVVIPEGEITAQAAKDRASWELVLRVARSQALEVQVSGWRQLPEVEEYSRPWRVNELVEVEIPSLDVAGDFLVNRVTFLRSVSEGTTTRLELLPPGAYQARLQVEASEAAFEAFRAGAVLEDEED